ncbi:MAG: fibronectin type III domain-containing protein, partial [Bacteroidetes bacterium]|nr:fibronectin type III domain-containing protein [Bacteroidota bacterium]
SITSDFAVFGKSKGELPLSVENFTATRHNDTRDVTFRWTSVKNAYAYNIYYGIAPDKLFSCIMVYDKSERHFRGLNKDVTYYARIEAISETGVSIKSSIVKF